MNRQTSIDAEAALSSTPDATLIADQQGLVVFASDRVGDIFGYTPDELLGQSIERLVPDGWREAHTALRGRFHAAPQVIPMKGRRPLSGLHKDGHVFPVEIGLSPIDGGRQVICVVRDVTTAKNREESLSQELHVMEKRAADSAADARQREEHLRLFIRHAPAAVAMLDNDMRYIMVSNRWLEDFDLKGKDLTGLSHFDVFPEIPEVWRVALRRALAGETLKKEEDTFVRADGRFEWLRWELCPWREADGAIGGILIFGEVITQRKLSELALVESRDLLETRVAERTRELAEARDVAERSAALKSYFLAATAHDLRQPLQAVMAYLSVLQARAAHAGVREICGRSQAQLQAMADILDSLLDLSRLQGGAITPHPCDFDVHDMITRVVTMHLPQAEAKELGLVQTGEPCIGHSDPALLERIIANLVANALRYTESGQVTVSSAYKSGAVEIAVSDTGIGIPADALATIFDDYVQLNNPARERSKGLGLGLSIVRAIADSLGHPIDVESRENQGSTFRIRIPRGTAAPQAHEGAQRQTGTETPPGPLHVLMVEDDPAVADSTAMLLRMEGCKVSIATSCQAAVALADDHLRPDIVLSDFRLPDGNGLDLIASLRQRLNARLPAILLTGDVAVQRAGAGELADCKILYKPVPFEQLIAALHSAVTPHA